MQSVKCWKLCHFHVIAMSVNNCYCLLMFVNQIDAKISLVMLLNSCNLNNFIELWILNITTATIDQLYLIALR